MKIIARCGVVLGLLFSASAWADIYTITGTLTDSSTIGGALDIDSILGSVSLVDLFVQDDPSDTFNQILFQTGAGSSYLEVTSTAANPSGVPAVFFEILNPADPGTLLGFTGGDLVTGSGGSFYLDAASNQTFFTSGSLSAATPEPRMTVLLLAIAGIGVFVHRFRRQQSHVG